MGNFQSRAQLVLGVLGVGVLGQQGQQSRLDRLVSEGGLGGLILALSVSGVHLGQGLGRMGNAVLGQLALGNGNEELTVSHNRLLS